MSKAYRLADIAELLGGRLQGANLDQTVMGLNTLVDAREDEISFLANTRYKADILKTLAAAVLVAEGSEHILGARCGLLFVKDPYLAFAKLQSIFHPQVKSQGERHSSACIDSSAVLADDVDVGACSVIEAGVVIAEGTRITAGCYLGKGVQLGKDCLLHAGAKVMDGCKLGDRVILQAGVVIGSDGFGYAWTGQEHFKIPQVGRVVLHNDVEIGANTCIDRGAIGDTIVHQGVKLDNLIQIGHNVEVGALSIMASQVGISGSTKVGRGCQIGGQVGTAGHLTIGDGCQLAARTGVTSDLEAGGIYAGMPAIPHRTWLKSAALFARLPDIWKKLKKIP